MGCFVTKHRLNIIWVLGSVLATIAPMVISSTWHNPREGILRDDAYTRTFKQDMRRQRLRRWVHGLAALYEQYRYVGTWKKPLPGPRPTLSVCIITMNSANRIGPLLQYLTPYVDEIVVGVDSKTTDDTLAVCEPIADTCFTIHNEALTCNGGLKELVSRCTGDWVLRLDDDEFPEPHFFDYVPGLLTQSKFTHFKLPRLHLSCWDDAHESLWWLNDGYLYPDFQMRLFKNEEKLLTFPEAVGHTSIGCAGKRGKINTVNLVHLNMAINPRWKREEKLAKYIQRLNGGWVHPVNESALLFEDYAYQVQRYDYPDVGFIRTMADTITHQRSVYGELAPRSSL